MPQRVIHHTNRTPASSSHANFKVQLASRIKRSIFATLVLIQRATTDTKFSKGTWHHKPQYKIRGKADGTATSQEDATRRHYILPKSSSPSAGVGPGDVDWRSPHTPKANQNPMPQRVIHHTNRTPANSSLANFKVQQASRIKRSIFATLSDHRHKIQQKYVAPKMQ